MRTHTHLGVYARILHNRNALLILKARGPYRNLWDLPGGSLHFGEAPESGLRRELLEETGLNLLACRLRGVVSFTHEYADAEGPVTLHHLGILYDVAIDAAAPLKSDPDGEDSRMAQWHSLDSLPAVSPLVAQAFDRAEPRG